MNKRSTVATRRDEFGFDSQAGVKTPAWIQLPLRGKKMCRCKASGYLVARASGASIEFLNKR